MRGLSSTSGRDLLLFMGAAFAVGCCAWGIASTGNPVTFVDIVPSAGITFKHENAATPEKHLVETMGSGCGWIDYDQSGVLREFRSVGIRIVEKDLVTLPDLF